MQASVHVILQARILEWVVISFSRISSWPRDRTHVSCIAGGFFTIWATGEALLLLWVHFKKGWQFVLWWTKTEGAISYMFHSPSFSDFFPLGSLPLPPKVFKKTRKFTSKSNTLQFHNWLCSNHQWKWSRPPPRKRNAKSQHGCLRPYR